MVTAQGNASDDASSVLEQGIKQIEAGQMPQASKTLARIDPVDLSADERVQLHKAIKALKNYLLKQSDPSVVLIQADNIANLGDLEQAAVLYQAVVKDVNATAKQQLKAAAHLASVRRRQTPQLSRMRQMIDQANTDMKAGRYEQASRKIQQVRESKVKLGWFDNAQLDRLAASLTEHQAAGRAPGANALVMASSSAIALAQDDSADEEKQTGLLAQLRSLKLQEKLASARAAEQKQQYHLAVKFYRGALQLDPNNEQAKAGLVAAQVKVDQSIAPRGPMSEVIGGRSLAAQAAIAEFSELMNKADKLRNERKYPGAQEAVQQARIRLDNSLRFLNTADYKTKRESATQLAVLIDEERRTFEQQKLEDIALQNEKETAVARMNAETETSRAVQELLVRARDLRMEQKYERSLELVNQALFREPQNFAAQVMKDMIEDSLFYVKVSDLNHQMSVETRRNRIGNHEARIPYNKLMTFPTEWPEMTQRRFALLDQTSPEAKRNRAIEAELRKPVPINFEENTLINVIDFLRNTTGKNFYVNWTALQNVGVEQDYPITLQLTNVPASQALELILIEASAGNELDPLDYAVHKGIVKISTERELKRTTVVSRIHDIRDLLVVIRDFSGAPSFSLESALGSGGTSGGSSGGSTTSLFGGDDDDDDDDDDDGEGEGSGGNARRGELVFQILDLIRQFGRPEDWLEFGGTISSVTELNGNLILRTTPEIHREVLTLLSQLRETRSMQINVEARFLLVDNNFLEEIGVDVDVRFNDTGDNYSPLTITNDTFNIAGRPNTGINGTFGQSLLNGGANSLSNFVIGSGDGSGRSLDLGISYLDDIEVSLLIRASQNSRRAVSVTAPRLTFFNGQRAFIAIARQISFVSALEPVPDAQGFNPTLSVTQSGVSLSVQGTISADRRFVTLELEPGLGNVVDIRRVEFITTIDNQNADDDDDDTFDTITGFIEAPETEVTELATTVSVPDRGTLLIGGQRLIGEIEIEAGVPVMSKIPLLNRLFTNRSKTKDERTLLILVKPTIIIQTEEEEMKFPGLRDNPAQFNLGRTSSAY